MSWSSTSRTRAAVVVSVVLTAGLLALGTKMAIKHRCAILRENRARSLFGAVQLLAMYDDRFRRVPPVVVKDDHGRTLGSWRFATMQFWPDYMPKGDVGSAWTDPANSEVANYPNPLFCLSDRSDTPSRLETNVFAIAGKGTAFDSADARFHALPKDLILLCEVDHSGIHWGAPGDYDVASLPSTLTCGIDGIGVLVAFADQQVWYLSRDVPLETLRKFLTPRDADRFDRTLLLGPYVLRTYYSE